ncbi:MAG TPA: hypothetical protein VK982_16760 [Bacteroidales bacterium]|nr:hypothetical protein [Bacteroidales bacterium]
MDNKDIEANLLEEKQWTATLNMAKSNLKVDEKNIMIFGAAFNLLLFAPKYKQEVLFRINNLLKNFHPITVMISVQVLCVKKSEPGKMRQTICYIPAWTTTIHCGSGQNE